MNKTGALQHEFKIYKCLNIEQAECQLSCEAECQLSCEAESNADKMEFSTTHYSYTFSAAKTKSPNI